MTKKLFKYLLLLFLIGLQTAAIQAQEFEEEEEEIVEAATTEISVQELVTLINQMDSDIFVQDVIVTSQPGDEKFLVDKLFYKEFVIESPHDQAVSLYLYNAQFKLGMNQKLVFKDWNFLRLNGINLSSDNDLVFENCTTDGSYPVRFENCSFDGILEFIGEETLGSIQFSGSNFGNKLDLNQDADFVKLENCRFEADSLVLASLDEERLHAQLDFSHHSFGLINLSDLTFEFTASDNLFSINFSSAEISKLSLFRINGFGLNLTDLNIEKSLLGDSLTISDFVAVQNFDFPAENTNLPWHNIAGEKLSLLLAKGSGRPEIYQAKTTQQFGSTLHYNELMSCYNKINGMYQARADRQSINESYIEIKDIETRYQKFKYDLEPSLNLFIGYHLNRFLSFFSDYATNPAKSLQIALYTILIFAFFYMISYSDWDGINFNYFVRQYMLLSEYFMTEKSLKELYSNDIEEEKEQFEAIKTHYLKNRSEIPLLVRGLGFPLYFFWNARQQLIWFVYSKIELMHGKWNQLGSSRKAVVGTVTALSLFIYFAMVLLIKFLNSFMLSLNMFLAMGFGKTPENRAPMYLTVIEGLIGWLMITIFTITLLSQLLQAW
ncbi:MAG: hypothetical protein KJ578_11605 [Bacteroidetes bacterium]|nr:hypothetical protein [Bacteroidota bacterium]MBU1579249.1 hypothetical protein [Bacteroidota bacterium]MBU2466641.1 hypothetical protein [Bacteroidota bacterium]MBU2558415.1 hypothetical protein [Bacteroidota bacterium]